MSFYIIDLHSACSQPGHERTEWKYTMQKTTCLTYLPDLPTLPTNLTYQPDLPKTDLTDVPPDLPTCRTYLTYLLFFPPWPSYPTFIPHLPHWPSYRCIFLTGPSKIFVSVRLHSKSHQKSSKCQNLLTGWHLETLPEAQRTQGIESITWVNLSTRIFWNWF